MREKENAELKAECERLKGDKLQHCDGDAPTVHDTERMKLREERNKLREENERIQKAYDCIKNEYDNYIDGRSGSWYIVELKKERDKLRAALERIANQAKGTEYCDLIEIAREALEKK